MKVDGLSSETQALLLQFGAPENGGYGAANHLVTGATRDAHEMFPPVM
jgi:hypothetical protein